MLQVVDLGSLRLIYQIIILYNPNRGKFMFAEITIHKYVFEHSYIHKMSAMKPQKS